MKKTLAPILLVLSLPLSVIAQDASRVLGDRTFSHNGDRWTQRNSDGEVFDVNPRVISVKFHQGVSREERQELHNRIEAGELREARTGWFDVELRLGLDVFDAIDAYLESGRVENAEPTTFGRYAVVPNDPQYGSQWQWPITDSETAWEKTTGGPGAVVAVLDSGTEFTHEDLGMGADAYQNVWLNAGEDAWTDPDNPNTGNGVDDDSNGLVDDWKGWDFASGNNNSAGVFFHGTAVAGMVAAKTHNGVDVAGVAGGWNSPGARVLIAGVGDTSPDGSVIDDAILYAIDEGAHVVQLSLTVGQSAALDDAFQMAWDSNLTIVCASGNSGSPTVGYPSSNPNVIAVGSTNSSDLRTSTSQYGTELEIAAPGDGIVTLDLSDGTLVTGGTSFAAPLVSGVIALMLDVNPSLTNAQIRQLLHDTPDKVGGYDYNHDPMRPGHSLELGYGRVNTNSAVEAASSFIFSDGFESGGTSLWSHAVP